MASPLRCTDAGRRRRVGCRLGWLCFLTFVNKRRPAPCVRILDHALMSRPLRCRNPRRRRRIGEPCLGLRHSLRRAPRIRLVQDHLRPVARPCDGCPKPSRLNFQDSDVSPSLARRVIRAAWRGSTCHRVSIVPIFRRCHAPSPIEAWVVPRDRRQKVIAASTISDRHEPLQSIRVGLQEIDLFAVRESGCGPQQNPRLPAAAAVSLMSFVKHRGHGGNVLHARRREVD